MVPARKPTGPAAVPLTIDGAHGEGGGQILRTALALSAITGRAMRIENIRAGRPKPGLAAQHLTSVRAAARLCAAEVTGDRLGSMLLEFAPRAPTKAGAYAFDVAEARAGGSAGAATLVLQTVLLPLSLARGDSTVTVAGGTHVPWSPSFDYLDRVWLATLARLGVAARLRLRRWGWLPVGGGEIAAEIRGRGRLRPFGLLDRGPLTAVSGRAVAANLPAHIAERMAGRARSRLNEAGLDAAIVAEAASARSPGAGIFLACDYAGLRAGFDALGERGRPSERVADEAVDALLAHHRSGAAVDPHLGDQLVLPAALAAGCSAFTVARATPHLRTNAWVIEQFGIARTAFESADGACVKVSVQPTGSAVGPPRVGDADP